MSAVPQRVQPHYSNYLCNCHAATTLNPPAVEVLRAAQRLEAQLGVPVAPKVPQRQQRSAPPGETNPWGPRPAPPSWGLDAAVASLSETWADGQLAQVHFGIFGPRIDFRSASASLKPFEQSSTPGRLGIRRGCLGQMIISWENPIGGRHLYTTMSQSWCALPQIHAWVVRQTEQEDWKPVQQERGCARY